MEKKLRIWDVERSTGGSESNGTNGSTHSSGAKGASQEQQQLSTEIGTGVHGASIKSIVWTHHPSILTTASDDRKIRYFDVRDPTKPIASHDVDGLIGSCELNEGIDGMNEGTLSVAAGKNVYFFDVSRPGTLVKHVKMDKEVASVAVSAAGASGTGNRKFVTGTGGDTWVHVWDYDTERELETGKGHHGPVWTVSFSPDGKLYATGSEDGTIKLWKATKGPYGLWR